MHYEIWKKIVLNSDLLWNKRLLLNDTLRFGFYNQHGGGKKLKIDYNDITYEYEQTDYDDDIWILHSTKGTHCVSVIFDRTTKTAEIHGATPQETTRLA